MRKNFFEQIRDAHVIKSIQGVDGLCIDRNYNVGYYSSREHTAWALYDYGFSVVVSQLDEEELIQCNQEIVRN